MVIGQYSSKLGEGNRVTFPKKFSKENGSLWLVTKGLDENLIMVASVDKKLLIERIETKPFTEAQIRQRQAFILGNTFEVELDKLNRFVIPPSLYAYAGITSEVIFAGIEHFVQVWDRKRWELYQKDIQSSVLSAYEQRLENE